MDSTPNLQLPYLMAAQAQKHVTHNEALTALDALVQLAVLDKDLSSPPGSPADGARYIVGAGPSGAWAGGANKIAAYQDGAWMLYPPSEGWLAWVADEDKLYVYSGTAWSEFVSGAGSLHHVADDPAPQLGGNLDANGHDIGFDDGTGVTDDSGNEQLLFHKTASAVNQVGITNAAAGNAPRIAAEGGDANINLELRGKGTGHVDADKLGINAAADTTNRLAVKSPSSLFDNVGNGHQHKINKAAAADTASTLYQTGYSGRAEYGLTGDDNFHIKVSPDGASWKEALVVDRTTASGTMVGGLLAQDFLVGQQQVSPQIVAVGDSLTVGTGGTGPYTSLISYPTWKGQSFTVTNIGVGGRTIRDMSRQAYSNLNPLLAYESGLNIAIVWGGTNDIAGSVSPEDTYSYLASFCRRLRGLGWRVVVLTMISRSGWDTQKNTYNGHIRSGWPSFADALADVAANANIGADGAYANTTYFAAGGVHLNDTGYAIVAGIVQAQLAILAGSVPNWFPPYGNVSIGGNASPGYRLEVHGTDATGQIRNYNWQSSNTGGFLTVCKSRGASVGSHAVVQAGDTLFTFVAQGSDGSAFQTSSKIQCEVDAAPSGTIVPGRVTFFTRSTGGSLAEWMRIDNAGKVGIGTTAPANKLSVEGIASPQTDNAYSCGTSSLRWSTIYAATGSINTSDQRLKTEIADSPLGLDFLLKCRPRAYKWVQGGISVEWDEEAHEEQEQVTEGQVVTRTVVELIDGRAVERQVRETMAVPVFDEVPVFDADGNPVMVPAPQGEAPRQKTCRVPRMAAVAGTRRVKREVPCPGVRTHYGLIAQEVKAALDEAGVSDFAGWVLEDKDDPASIQSLRYDQFIAPLIKAVQELAARLAVLEAR